MKTARLLAALAALQLLLAGGYWAVEASRSNAPAFHFEPLNEAAPALSVVQRDGAVPTPETRHVVHFWATWCAPCVEELPSLLAAAEAERVPLLAVTDEPWPVVDAWFGGTVPAAVVHDPSGTASRAWEVSGLPDTFVVQSGRITARVGGPRDWSTPAARRFLRGEIP